MTEIIDPKLEMIINEPIDQEVPPTPKRKYKKPMSEHHKAKCVESLKKAREASAIKRKKTAEAKKIMKKEEEAKLDAIINSSREKENKKNDERDRIILRLQKQLDNITLNDVIKKPPPKPKIETIIEEEEEEEPIQIPVPEKIISKPPIQPKEIPSQIKNEPIMLNLNIPKPYKCKVKKNKASKFF